MKLFSREEFLNESMNKLFGVESPSHNEIEKIYLDWISLKKSKKYKNFFDYLKTKYLEDSSIIDNIKDSYFNDVKELKDESNIPVCDYIANKWRDLLNESLDKLFSIEMPDYKSIYKSNWRNNRPDNIFFHHLIELFPEDEVFYNELKEKYQKKFTPKNRPAITDFLETEWKTVNESLSKLFGADIIFSEEYKIWDKKKDKEGSFLQYLRKKYPEDIDHIDIIQKRWHKYSEKLKNKEDMEDIAFIEFADREWKKLNESLAKLFSYEEVDFQKAYDKWNSKDSDDGIPSKFIDYLKQLYPDYLEELNKIEYKIDNEYSSINGLIPFMQHEFKKITENV